MCVSVRVCVRVCVLYVSLSGGLCVRMRVCVFLAYGGPICNVDFQQNLPLCLSSDKSVEDDVWPLVRSIREVCKIQ